MNDFNKDLYFFGFSNWGFHLIKNFFKPQKVFICQNLTDAIQNGISSQSVILMYPTKKDMEVISFAKEHDIKVAFVEDGFIRSLTLGSSFFKPASLVVDYRGIYYDPSSESDLEYILNNHNFDIDDIGRAKKLIKLILDMNISKYNHLQDKKINHSLNKKNILVIGQVDDDMSIKKGGFGFDSLKLLQVVRENNNDFIIYKPHPDVVAGIRNGNLDIKYLKKFADEIVMDSSLNSCLKVADEVHTITSLSGLEALIRNKKVFTYGMPFYAGWGLSVDMQKCDRRIQKITLEELIYATYILYPRYVSLFDNNFCEAEQTINEIVQLKNKYFNNSFFRAKVNLMGKMGVMLRDFYHLIKN